MIVDVNITPLMARCMDALYKDHATMTTSDLSISITDARFGVPISQNQLGSPLGRLRKLRWVKREKRIVGHRHVGAMDYPLIERFYSLTPLGVDIWRSMGSTIDPVKGGTFSIYSDTKKATGLYSTLESEELPDACDHKWIDHYNVAAPVPSEPDRRLCGECGKMEVLQEIETVEHAEHDERSFKPDKTALFGRHTIFTDKSPYMTRLWFGRLRFHIFHRGDGDSPHDHPWDFKTYPLTSYVEEVFYEVGPEPILRSVMRVVPAGRPSWRKAEFRHRVVGRYAGYVVKEGNQMDATPDVANVLWLTGWRPAHDSRKIYTIVWRGRERRDWGFWIKAAGKWCWQAWKDVKANGFKNHCD
jgi:hypothetical protein